MTLRGNTSEVFQGFLVVAVNAGQRVGSFTPGGADSKTTCSVYKYAEMFEAVTEALQVLWWGCPQIILECHFQACMPLPLTCINV